MLQIFNFFILMTSSRLSILYVFLIATLLVACGNEKGLDAKKKKFQAKQAEIQKIEAEIAALKAEILKEDPKFFENEERKVLITTLPVEKADFVRYIENRGNVSSDKNVLVTAKTMGTIKALYVREGQAIAQGQSILLQDADVINRNIDQVKTNLELAKIVYEKQAKLWEQKIGTELQYLQAKNSKESLERNLQALQAQAAQSVLTAPFSGIVDEVFARQGEMASPNAPAIRLVSLAEVKVKADIPEAYIGKLKVGDEVALEFPSIQKEQSARISSIGQVINPNNRTFKIEINLSNPTGAIKPEMQAIIKLKEYEQKDALIIPTNLIQQDISGDFVFVAEPATSTVRKVNVKTGESYKGKTVITEGLKSDDLLVDEGFRLVSERSKIQVKQANAAQ